MSFLLASASHYIGIGIDVAVVILLLIYACIGYHDGLLKSLIGLFSTAVVLFLSIYFANKLAHLLNTIYDFTALIAGKIAPSIKRLDEVFNMTFPDGMSGSEFYGAYISTSGINSVLKTFFKFALKGYSAESLNGLNVGDVLGGAVASIIMTVIAGILLFIVIKIAIGLLSRFFDNITKTHVLGGLNKIFGFFFGAIKGLAIILFFVLVTICCSFVPKINKTIYPMIQNETKVVKVIYNTSDKLVEKYVVKSDVISKWINNLWDNRYLESDSDDTPETIEDKSTSLDVTGFANVGDTYTKTFTDIATSADGKYYKLSTLSDITSPAVSISITISSEGSAFELYSTTDLNTAVEKEVTSTTTVFNYDNLNYTNYIFELKNSTNATVSITVTITAEFI